MASPRHTHQTRTGTEQGMHVCPKCRSDYVQPMDWTERDSDSWAVELRCPECEWRGAGVFSQAQIDRYDTLLDEGSRALAGDLRTMTRDNMEHEAESFAAALQSGAILPEDF